MADNSFMISDYGKDIIFPKFEFDENNTIGNLKLILNTFSKQNDKVHIIV